AGSGDGSFKDGAVASFDEPAGVSIAFGKLFVADTNNHAIRTIDLKTRHVETLKISGLERLLPRASTSKRKLEAIELPSQSVSPGEASLCIALEMPSGLKLNLEGPSEVTVTVGN